MNNKLMTKRRLTKSALINFEASLLAELDDRAKKLGVSRTRLVEVACMDALQKYKERK